MYTSSYAFVASLRNTSVESTSFSSLLHHTHQSLPLNTATTGRLFALALASAAPRSSENPWGVDDAAKTVVTDATTATASVLILIPVMVSPIQALKTSSPHNPTALRTFSIVGAAAARARFAPSCRMSSSAAGSFASSSRFSLNGSNRRWYASRSAFFACP